MLEKKGYAKLKQGVEYWNKWRAKNSIVKLNLSNTNLSGDRYYGD